LANFNICHDFRYGKIIYNQMDVYIGKSLKLYGEYSQGESELFGALVRAGDWVIEGGANIGAFTVHLAQLAGENGRVFAFEPQRLVFQLLAGNIAINSLTNVYCLQKCLSDETSTVKVPVRDPTKANNFGGYSMRTDYPEGDDVEVITLDSLQLPRCDFIKLDIEDMELKALKGAENLIEKFHPIIYTEANPGEKRIPLFNWLRERGYKIYPHTPFLYNSKNYFNNPENVFPTIASFNVLCIPLQRNWIKVEDEEVYE